MQLSFNNGNLLRQPPPTGQLDLLRVHNTRWGGGAHRVVGLVKNKIQHPYL
jgi:hypothetical protein